jgi:uncharacterized protein YqgV (UPF0045/DUF77 family)
LNKVPIGENYDRLEKTIELIKEFLDNNGIYLAEDSMITQLALKLID